MMNEIADSYREIAVGVLTGVLSAAVTGVIPFLLQLKWRRDDQRDEGRRKLGALTRELEMILAQNLTNHELTARTGRKNTTCIMQTMTEMMTQGKSIAAALKPAQAARLNALLNAYCESPSQKDEPDLTQTMTRNKALADFLLSLH